MKKRILIIVALLIAKSLLFKSCNQDQGNDIQIEEEVQALNSAQVYVDTSVHVDFDEILTNYHDSLLDKITLAVDAAIDTIVESGGEIATTPLNLQPINDYMEYMGREPIDLMQYHNEAQALLSDTNTTYHDVAALLEKYHIYSTATIEKWKELEAYLDTVSTVAAYNARIDSFVNEVNEDPNIPAIEKIMLKTYGAVVKLDESVSLRGKKCRKCAKWAIKQEYGWFRWMMYGLTFLSCVVGPLTGYAESLKLCFVLILMFWDIVCGACCEVCWFCTDC